jgi:hypothetical protein
VLGAAQELEQPHPERDRRPGEPAAVGCAIAGSRPAVERRLVHGLRHERAVRVGDEELRLAQQLGGRAVLRVGLRPRVAHGPADGLFADRVTLCVVALEQPFRRFSASGEGELPGEVVRILDPGVHALGPGRRMDVRGVAGDEDPSLPVAVDEPVADPEDRRPAEIRGRGRLGGEAVDHGLDLVERGSRSIGDQALLRLRGRRGRELGRHEHRHPVAAVTWQRDANQEVVGLALSLVQRPDHDAGRKAPVDLDVAEHVLLGKCPTLEGQPEALPHRAVGAVAADEILRTDGLRSVRPLQRRDDSVLVGVEPLQLDAALDLAGQLRELLPEDPLGLVLREPDEPVRDLGRELGLGVEHLLAVHEHEHPAELDCRVERRLEDAEVFPDLERTRLDADGLRIQRRLLQAVDDPARGAMPP